MADTNNSAPSFRFPKAQKLWGETSVDMLFARGEGFTRFPLRVVYLVRDESRPGEAPLRMMVSVGKKRFKRAVKRNRVKRLVREAWRLRKGAVERALAASRAKGLYVGFVFVGKELPSMIAVSASMAKAVDKLVDSLSPASMPPVE